MIKKTESVLRLRITARVGRRRTLRSRARARVSRVDLSPRPAISSAVGKAEETVESERRRRNQDGSCVRYNAGFLAVRAARTFHLLQRTREVSAGDRYHRSITIYFACVTGDEKTFMKYKTAGYE